jgi:hypothetical protein
MVTSVRVPGISAAKLVPLLAVVAQVLKVRGQPPLQALDVRTVIAPDKHTRACLRGGLGHRSPRLKSERHAGGRQQQEAGGHRGGGCCCSGQDSQHCPERILP